MNVEDVMVQKVITVKANATVKQAVKTMNRHGIGCLIVEDEGRAVGILTERDLLKRVLAECRNPEKTRVHEVMSKPLIFVEPKMDIEEAASLMFRNRIKKLPVVEDGRLVGIVTVTDIARSSEQMLKMLKRIFVFTTIEMPPEMRPKY